MDFFNSLFVINLIIIANIMVLILWKNRNSEILEALIAYNLMIIKTKEDKEWLKLKYHTNGNTH